MKKSSVLALAALLASVWLGPPCLAQGPESKAPPPQAPRMEPQRTMITGNIYKDNTGYYIQGKKPPEVFTISNPDPKVLDRLAKSGKTVTIEAGVVLGDNVAIEKIDGKPYQGPKEGKPKGK